MIIPVRCFSCGGVVAHKWEEFQRILSEGKTDAEALDEVGLKRYCCRRMYVGHLDLVHEVAPFSAARN
ncbi:MAG: DNA-directed RNA polymerase subunit N [Candidatus Poseidonia sp.]|nr:DNA-directed RNA polymerase subunit N [Poseidonia sp.]